MTRRTAWEGDAQPARVGVVSLPPGDGKEHFGLWTRTPVDETTIPIYRDEVRHGKLIYAYAQTDRLPDGTINREIRFCITEEFIAEHWRCGSGALLYLDTCESAAPKLVDACLTPEVNASCCIGWTHKTFDRYSTPTARYFFDRTLGVNQYQPVLTPPQRPFTANQVIAAMAGLSRLNLPLNNSPSKGLRREIVDGATPPTSVDPPVSTLVATLRGDTEDVLLRPGIRQLASAESPGRLTVYGDFGATPGAVTLNGAELTQRDAGWATDRIECELPEDASGAVEVVVDGRTSNPRNLTRWNLTLRQTFMDYPTQGGLDCPDCFYDATLHYTLRADVGDVRENVEGDVAPLNATGSAATADIEVTNAGGSFPIGQGSTITLSPNPDDGAQTIGTCVGFLPPADNNFIGACFFIDRVGEIVNFSPTILAQGLYRAYTGGAFDGIIEPYAVSYNGNLVDLTLMLPLTPSGTIQAGTQATGPNSQFEWDAANPENPMGSDDAK